VRKVWLVIAAVVTCLGLGLAIVGCGSSTTTNKGKMENDKKGEKMENDKKGEKMEGEKKGDKM
jgi:hypothetical protein